MSTMMSKTEGDWVYVVEEEDLTCRPASLDLYRQNSARFEAKTWRRTFSRHARPSWQKRKLDDRDAIEEEVATPSSTDDGTASRSCSSSQDIGVPHTEDSTSYSSDTSVQLRLMRTKTVAVCQHAKGHRIWSREAAYSVEVRHTSVMSA